MKRVSFIAVVVVLILIGCKQKTVQPDVEKDIAAIHAVYDKYLDCINTENLEEFLTLWTDDAIRSEPDIPEITGIEKLTPHFSYFHKNFDMTMDYASQILVKVWGDEAYAMGVVTYSAAPLAGGDTAVFDIKYLDILKRQEDGSWKIYIDCINFQPAWSMDSVPEELTDEENPYY